MAHKHRRKHAGKSDHNLPPFHVAKSLPGTTESKNRRNPRSSSGRPPTNSSENPPVDTQTNLRVNGPFDSNDTPRGFRRLMSYAHGQRPRHGLDDGIATEIKAKMKRTTPAILPGEDMSVFSARVNAAISVTTADIRHIKSGKDPLGLKTWKTRKEFKMHRLYDQWREEDRKLKDLREQLLEEQCERAGTAMGLSTDIFERFCVNPCSGKRDNDDPWAVLKHQRGSGI